MDAAKGFTRIMSNAVITEAAVATLCTAMGRAAMAALKLCPDPAVVALAPATKSSLMEAVVSQCCEAAIKWVDSTFDRID